MNVHIDTETLPSDREDIAAAIRVARTQALAEAEPPRKITDIRTPEKREQRLEEWKRELAASFDDGVTEDIHSTALMPGFARICVVCFAVDDEAIQAHYATEKPEAQILQDVVDRLQYEVDIRHRRQPFFIGANTQFDLHNLWFRCRQLGVGVPWAFHWQKQPWHEKYGDVLYETFGTSRAPSGSPEWRKHSLSGACLRWGVKDRDTITGADVAKTWAAGDYQTVIDHCRMDVEKVRQIWNIVRPGKSG